VRTPIRQLFAVKPTLPLKSSSFAPDTLFLFLQPLAQGGIEGIAARAWMSPEADLEQIDVFAGSADVNHYRDLAAP
jgi:hypothetical protein